MKCDRCSDSGVRLVTIKGLQHGLEHLIDAFVICNCDAGVACVRLLEAAVLRERGMKRAMGEAVLGTKAARDGRAESDLREARLRATMTPETPADRLADAVDAFGVEAPNVPVSIEQWRILRDALTAYRSTRAAHPSFNDLVGNPPDPVKLARYLLDSLTGGALSALICQVRDHALNPRSEDRLFFDNLISELRALGEDL